LDSSSQSSPILFLPDPRIATGGGTGFTNAMAFTPDGKSVAYIVRDQGVDNILRNRLTARPDTRSPTSLLNTSPNFNGRRMEKPSPSLVPRTPPMWSCSGKSNDCHPEQVSFAPRKLALSEAEGDLGEPREVACPEQAKRAGWVAACPERAQATEGFFATQ